jgi:hypothetical protein
LRSDQRGSAAGGDQAGRDIIKEYNVPIQTKKSHMEKLIEQYQEEIERNEEFSYFIDALQHYLEKIDEFDVKGISEKLKDGKREEEITEARRLKELFAKKLQENQFSASAQKIFAFLLGNIRERFRAKIYPMIYHESDKYTVDSAIFDDILNPVFAELETNILDITYQDLRGMLYYLTGNCHIRWSA